MADEDVQIHVQSTADNSGIESAQRSLSQLNQQVASNTQTQAKETEATKEDSRSKKELADKTENLTTKKKDLREAVQGLQEVFPGLARIARLAIEPLGLATAALVGSFALWKARVDGLATALSNVELPDNKATDPGHVNALAEAWGKYREQMQGAADARHSFNKATERTIANLERELELQNKLTEAEQKAGLKTEGESQREQFDREMSTEQAKINARLDLASEQSKSALAKRAEAAGIRIAEEKDDADTEAKLLRNKEIAEKEIAERREWRGRLIDAQAGGVGSWASMRLAIPAYLRYGMSVTRPDELASMIGMEDQGIASAQVNIDRYGAWRRNSRFRGEARARRGQLLNEAGSEQAAAEDYFYGEYPGEQSGLNRRRQVGERVLVLNELERAKREAAEGEKAAADLTKQIAAQIKERRKADQLMLQSFAAQENHNAEVEARIKRLDAQVRALR